MRDWNVDAASRWDGALRLGACYWHKDCYKIQGRSARTRKIGTRTKQGKVRETKVDRRRQPGLS